MIENVTASENLTTQDSESNKQNNNIEKITTSTNNVTCKIGVNKDSQPIIMTYIIGIIRGKIGVWNSKKDPNKKIVSFTVVTNCSSFCSAKIKFYQVSIEQVVELQKLNPGDKVYVVGRPKAEVWFKSNWQKEKEKIVPELIIDAYKIQLLQKGEIEEKTGKNLPGPKNKIIITECEE